MAHTITHAHRAWRSLYRDDRADSADRRDFRAAGIWSAHEALGALLDDEAADWGDLFADEDGYFDRVDTDAYYGDDRDREDALHAEALADLARHNAEQAAAERADRLGLDLDAICGWTAPTALVWSDWTDNSIYQEA